MLRSKEIVVALPCVSTKSISLNRFHFASNCTRCSLESESVLQTLIGDHLVSARLDRSSYSARYSSWILRFEFNFKISRSFSNEILPFSVKCRFLFQLEPFLWEIICNYRHTARAHGSLIPRLLRRTVVDGNSASTNRKDRFPQKGKRRKKRKKDQSHDTKLQERTCFRIRGQILARLIL